MPNKLSPYAAWEGEIYEHIEEKLEVTRSDAQGIVMAQEFAMSQAWGMGLNSVDAAKKIMDASFVEAPARPK